MAKKILIGISMDNKMQETIQNTLKDFRFNKDDTIEFLHVFEEENYVYMVPPIIYPASEQKAAIKDTVLNIMKSIWENAGDKNLKNIKYECLFDENPRERFCNYLKENKADLCLIATRGKHGIEGLFTSSFADYLNKFSPCDIWVARPK